MENHALFFRNIIVLKKTRKEEGEGAKAGKHFPDTTVINTV